MYAIVDIETTGYNNTCNNITEIAIILYDGKKVVDSFHSLINPQGSINPYVSRLTGITNEMVMDAPTFGEVAKKVWSITENAVFVAHSVNFDYSIIRNEFKSFGADFRRKKLCTVRLSRKIFPGHNLYSLGNICGNLGIKINDRHRAMGDAKATVKLFEQCLLNDNEGVIKKSLKKNSKEATLPPNLEKDVYEKLPEQTGVYYFHNKAGKVIYVGKAINIKQRIYSHFTQNKRLDFLNEVHDITYEVTGSELVALLLESDEIKKLYPLYNQAQKTNKNGYCLFEYFDRKGIHRISMGRQVKGIQPLVGFNNFDGAREYVFKVIEKYELCPKCCGVQTSAGACFDFQIKKCKGVCADNEEVSIYNKRVAKALKEIKAELGDIIITDKGRNNHEKAIVVVDKGVYKGFGYIEAETRVNDVNEALNYVTPYKDNYDIQKIINAWVRK